MGYLRGTNKPKTFILNRQVPVDYKIKALQRQINHQKPSIENSLSTHTTTAGSAGYARTNHNITNSLVTSADFSKIVIGDRFSNLYLQHTHVFPVAVTNARVLVLHTRRTGVTPSFGLNDTGFAQPVDPNFCTVLSEHYINLDNARPKTVKLRTNLRNITTVYNRSTSILESGEIYMIVMYNASTGTTATSQAQIFFRNK